MFQFFVKWWDAPGQLGGAPGSIIFFDTVLDIMFDTVLESFSLIQFSISFDNCLTLFQLMRQSSGADSKYCQNSRPGPVM